MNKLVICSFCALFFPLFSQADTFLHVAAYPLNAEQGYFEQRTLSGQVTKEFDAQLSFEFAGKVTQFYADQGDLVTKGHVIAEQDTQLLAIELTKIAATNKKLNAQLQLAQLEQQRLKKLSKQDYSAVQQLDQVNTQIAVLDAEQALLTANQTEIKLRMDKARLLAPFDGRLGQRFISAGENVAAGTAVVRLLEQQQSQVSIGIPTALQSAIKETMQITIAGQEFQAHALSKGANLDKQTQTLTMRFALPLNANVYAGQLAKLKINQYQDKAGFWVPLDALADGLRGTWQVYKIVENNLKPVIVQLIYSDGQFAFINGPLNTGEQIVANGTHKVSANIAVNVVEQLAPRTL
ncbi:efflux RND transporter periplasmic adaptor subunit [Pseudoalteromonas tunicata]|uniref:efflux RND transporter periplasmic adaptor subunit n=1 Tax=Pseudoalteromonas tunicata TaxID=314281 RepID=UPI00273D4C1A|nr:efflux RND transporter periplasmic adaptor subunit [Pseudoalteromonas tunicata]MDP4984428.1 efflux RND transporter periplasmic adaptor subunit [Pseudoalteromonas tunicata]